MSDAEFFNPGEGGESYDPAAFERFKDQMKKNAAFMATARKGEQKQKQKEDRLAKILLQFIQKNQKSSIVMLAARLLEENIPASFILAIIILGNEQLLQEAQDSLPELAAPAGSPPTSAPSEFSLMTQFGASALPLEVKARMDSWGKGIFEAGSTAPFRVLETALTREGEIKKVVIDCAANVLQDFLEAHEWKDLDYDTFFSFCGFLMQGTMKKLREQIENQKELN